VEDAGQIDRVSREGYDEKSEMELGSVVCNWLNSRFAKLLKTTLFDLTISFPILESLILKTTGEKTKDKNGRDLRSS